MTGRNTVTNLTWRHIDHDLMLVSFFSPFIHHALLHVRTSVVFLLRHLILKCYTWFNASREWRATIWCLGAITSWTWDTVDGFIFLRQIKIRNLRLWSDFRAVRAAIRLAEAVFIHRLQPSCLHLALLHKLKQQAPERSPLLFAHLNPFLSWSQDF